MVEIMMIVFLTENEVQSKRNHSPKYKRESKQMKNIILTFLNEPIEW